VQTTRDYYAKQSDRPDHTLDQGPLGTAIGAIMAIGAVFGALNTMYAAVAGRAREIATLRAIGFRGLPVVIAVMLETMLLALLGGALGAAIAYVVFNGYSVATLGGNFSQVVFQFQVTPELLWSGHEVGARHRLWSAACSPRCARRVCRWWMRCARAEAR
jgi:putative ABC transport system permease protein